MTSNEWPEADALEQRRPVVDDDLTDENGEGAPLSDIEVDPADALEQRRPAGGDERDEYPDDDQLSG